MNSETKEPISTGIFYSEKNEGEWYNLDGNGKKNWFISQTKVTEFWRLFRQEKIQKGDYDFTNFIFPEIPEMELFHEEEIPEQIIFNDSIFLDKVHFRYVKFKERASFHSTSFLDHVLFLGCEFTSAFFDNAHFYKEASFIDAVFNYSALFSDCVFGGDSTFRSSIFQKSASFSCVFEKEADFMEVQFSNHAYFDRTEFRGSSVFDRAQFNGFTRINRARFGNESSWDNVEFLNANDDSHVLIESVIFNDKYRILFNSWDLESSIHLKNVVFTDQVYFQQCDFAFVSFERCDIKMANFSNCEFYKEFGRIKFLNDGLADLKELSQVYRQLKQNMMINKDWQNAGDAYRSEMVMERKFRWKSFVERPYKIQLLLDWLIRTYYEYGSGYHQSFIRPLLLLVILIISSAVLIHMLFNTELYVSTQESLEAALPIIGKINSQNPYYFVLVIERLISVSLLSFLVLALRARLRQ